MFNFIIIRHHRMHCIDAAYTTDVTRSMVSLYVCLSVCLSVGHIYGWALQKRLNRSRCRLGCWLARMDITNHVLDGDRDPSTERFNFGGCPAHWEAGGVSAAVYAAKK